MVCYSRVDSVAGSVIPGSALFALSSSLVLDDEDGSLFPPSSCEVVGLVTACEPHTGSSANMLRDPLILVPILADKSAWRTVSVLGSRLWESNEKSGRPGGDSELDSACKTCPDPDDDEASLIADKDFRSFTSDLGAPLGLLLSENFELPADSIGKVALREALGGETERSTVTVAVLFADGGGLGTGVCTSAHCEAELSIASSCSLVHEIAPGLAATAKLDDGSGSSECALGLGEGEALNIDSGASMLKI